LGGVLDGGGSPGNGGESSHEVVSAGAIHDRDRYPGSTNGSGGVEPGVPAADDQYAIDVVCSWLVVLHVGGDQPL
jgi:hypothetical protein